MGYKTSEGEKMKLLVVELETLITDKQYRQLFKTKHTHKTTMEILKNKFRGNFTLRDAWVSPTNVKAKRGKK